MPTPVGEDDFVRPGGGDAEQCPVERSADRYGTDGLVHHGSVGPTGRATVPVMTEDPFELADPTVVSIVGVAFARCPCGWEGAMFSGKRDAQPDLDRHLREAHPDRFPAVPGEGRL